MKILHVVTNADLGGAPRVVTELANRAVCAGHTCGAATVPVGPFWDHLDPRVERIPLRHLRRNLDPVQDCAALLELAALIRRWKPDIVHLHSSKVGVLGRLAALLSSCGAGRRIPTVYTIHGFDTILKTHRTFLPLERMMARCTSAIVPVSAYDEKNLKRAGIHGTIRLIRNGASDRLGRAPDPLAAARIEAARARGSVILLSIARLEPPKRFDLFLDTARRAPEDMRFFWIGNVRAAIPPGLPRNVEMLGEVPEAGNCINLCDIFLLLSDYEGFPMSILEALSCGKPIVASDVGGISEALDPDAGFLVPNDREAVLTAINRLASDRDLRARLGASARSHYERSFSADSMWHRYLQLYTELSHTGS